MPSGADLDRLRRVAHRPRGVCEEPRPFVGLHQAEEPPRLLAAVGVVLAEWLAGRPRIGYDAARVEDAE